jgi:hypothetical protein
MISGWVRRVAVLIGESKAWETASTMVLTAPGSRIVGRRLVDPPAFGERVEFAWEAAGVRGAVDLVGDVR